MTDSSAELTIDRRATVSRTPLGTTAWVDVVSRFVHEPSQQFEALHGGLRWHQNEVLRYDHYVGERRLSASVPRARFALSRHTSLHLEARYGVAFSGVAAILYRDGDDFQGLHSDREMRWLDETLVAIVVLGERRPFVLRPRVPWAEAVDRAPAGSGHDDLVLRPGHGDLLVMGGACQRDWLHGVPAAPGASARISLTWRWTSRRGRPDTNPAYSEGRQFAGEPRRPGSRARPARPSTG